MSIQFKKRLIIFFILLPLTLSAQNKELNLQIYGGASIPTSNFAKMIDYPNGLTRREGINYGGDVGLASKGYLVGVELTKPVLIDGLGWQISAKFIYNQTDNSKVEKKVQADPIVTGTLKLKTGEWINVPVFSGFSYGINLSESFNIYYHLQAGINFSKPASRKATLNDVIVENTEFITALDFGFETGISIDFMDKYSLMFRYLDLRSPGYEGNRTLNELLFPEIVIREYNIISEEKSVKMFFVTFGMKIF